MMFNRQLRIIADRFFADSAKKTAPAVKQEPPKELKAIISKELHTVKAVKI